tara:strand:- start:282 stop:527 length:246 start_codon:yes stop_codon:yes gene_type:complete
MSLLTNIDDVPLYSTVKEALDWARANGLRGFHTHQYNGITGYMGGFNHNNAVTGFNNQNTSNNNTPPPSASSMSGSSGGSY